MRYIKYAFIISVAIVLIVVSMGNRGDVTLNLWPGEIAALVGFAWSVTLPLYVVLFGGIISGLLLGFCWEWVREHKHRAAAARKTREVSELKRELSKAKTANVHKGDDVLALLD